MICALLPLPATALLATLLGAAGHVSPSCVQSQMNRARGFRPAAFVPRQNPFYVALPYNDCYDCKSTKAEAARVVPWFYQAFKKCGQSVCKDRWIAIRCGDRSCYAQWSDCGPFSTED